MNLIQLPSRKVILYFIIVMAIWFSVTGLFIGFRIEHIVFTIAMFVLFLGNDYTRRLILAVLPFIIFVISYDCMNLCPNYEVNPVDIKDIYDAEKSLFGITLGDGNVVTLNEFFLTHKSVILDFLAGCFYLCWVPVPVLFGLGLFVFKQYNITIRFTWTFLFANLIGFCGYYIHPTAPPWYIMKYGFDLIQGIPGEVAGLGAFDELMGINVFHDLYVRNSNVFAALPSLHSAYMTITFYYSLKAKCPNILRVLFGFIMCGIWFTAIYTSQHYLIDVLCGICCAIIAIFLFELAYNKTNLKRKIEKYEKILKGNAY